jgi:hypothetical protein
MGTKSQLLLLLHVSWWAGMFFFFPFNFFCNFFPLDAIKCIVANKCSHPLSTLVLVGRFHKKKEKRKRKGDKILFGKEKNLFRAVN